MKIVTASNGKKTVKISKAEWQAIGKTAGWMKTAQPAGFGSGNHRMPINFDGHKIKANDSDTGFYPMEAIYLGLKLTYEELIENLKNANNTLKLLREEQTNLNTEFEEGKIDDNAFNDTARALSREIRNVLYEIREINKYMMPSDEPNDE